MANAGRKKWCVFYWCRLEYEAHNFNAVLLLLLFLSLTLNKIKCRLIAHITRFIVIWRRGCGRVVCVCASVSGNRKCLWKHRRCKQKKPHHENLILICMQNHFQSIVQITARFFGWTIEIVAKLEGYYYFWGVWNFKTIFMNKRL